MMTQQRCAICDCDRDGNVWPESAGLLCADHWPLASVRDLVTCGAWSEFDMNLWGKRPNHAGMLLTRNPKEAAKRHPWQAVLLAACNAYSDRHNVMVWWDDGTGDATESEGDRYALMTGLVAEWVIDAIEAAARDRKRRAA